MTQYNWQNETLTVGDQEWKLVSISIFRFKILENGQLNPITFDNIEQVEDYITPDVFEAYKKIGQVPFGRLAKKCFAFTGKMLTPRANLEALVIQNGGYVHKTVNRKTDFLVSNTNKTNNARKASKLGTIILTEDELDFLYNTNKTNKDRKASKLGTMILTEDEFLAMVQ